MSQMFKKPNDALNEVIEEINYYKSLDAPVPLMTAEKYYILVQDKEPGLANYMLAMAYTNHRNYVKALEYVEKSWQSDPLSVSTYTLALNLCHTIGKLVIERFKVEKSHSEFLQVYKILSRLGEVDIRMHMNAAISYLELGDTSSSLEIAIKLSSVAPKYPGLQKLLKALQAPLIQKTKITGGIANERSKNEKTINKRSKHIKKVG